MISFYRWCVNKYHGGDSPLGDLASDMKGDKNFPKKSKDRNELLSYLRFKNACDGCLKSFNYAFRIYSSEVLNERK
ncbi:hypothetical protein SDC9_173338 [bioreactor metagenome]|uniref:YozE SAM-like domain-containing protein n=1 Tax=bioreactor metagenome TaxID=1076179 RepID=A0A645GG67_9ZZZZ